MIAITFGTARFSDWTKKLDKLIEYKISHEHISKLVKQCDISSDLLIILSYTDSELLTKNDNLKKLQPYFRYILYTNYETVQLLDDNYMFTNFMIQNDMYEMVPKIYEDNIVYPCILKQNRNAYGGNHVFIINNEDELKMRQSKLSNWIIKELIRDKTEYTTHILAINGKIIESITYSTTYRSEQYIKRGAAKIDKREIEHKGMFDKIFKLLNYNGFACLNYKIIDNHPKIFEINPRIGGSLINETTDLNLMMKSLITVILK